eukprot:TRINITY_DN128_c0_g1_i1.p1 TRINITY_DN128_c0_g1~~TRINITY_DN128_c0_g1_i1.p1  ORF type:complete len:324 (+),score=80.01 TRINITY_DN128_c0_g1_i1:97-1068(+)
MVQGTRGSVGQHRLQVLRSHLHAAGLGAALPAAAPPASKGIADRGGVRIAYLVYRPTGRAVGLPVLMLRGFGMTKEDSAGLATALTAHGRVMVAVDNRGSGESDFPEGDYTLEDMARDAASVMGALGAERYHVCGVSMGGAVALLTAIADQRRVASVSVGCSYFGGPNMAPVPTDYYSLATQEYPKEEEAFRTWVLTLFRFNFTEEWREGEGKERFAELLRDYEAAERSKRDRPPRSAKGQTRAVLRFFKEGIEDQVRRLQTPALVFTGDKDRVVPPVNTDLLAERLPRAQKVVLAGHGHMFWEESPAKTAATLTAFWAQHDR